MSEQAAGAGIEGLGYEQARDELTEVVRALEKVHALALETGATAHAGHIADLITTLHRNG